LLKYLQSGEDSNDIDHLKFKHHLEPVAKLNAFKLLTKWIQEQYLSINSIIEYNPSAIVSSYISNIRNAASASFQSELKNEYLKTIEQLNEHSILIITNLLVEEMKEKHLEDQRRDIYFTLLKETFRVQESLLSNEEYCTKMKFVLNLEKHYSK
jgi:hypothetical protein